MKAGYFIKIFFFVILLGIYACPIEHPINDKYDFNKNQGVFITNEGIFQQANASVSYYDYLEDSVYENVFQNANTDKIGDILQSAYILEDNVYLVVNNSSWIYVTDAKTMIKKAEIDGFVSPRYFLPVSSKKAYVTDLYSNYIYVVDLIQNKITGRIFTGRWTEEMAVAGDRLYVSCPWFYNEKISKKILIIDIKTDKLTDSLQTGINPKSIGFDANGYLWTLNSGNNLENITGSIYKIDPANKNVLDSFKFETTLKIFTASFCFNKAKDSIFVLYNDVYKFSVNNKINPKKIIERDKENFYGIGIDDNNGKIYLTDAVDFASNGKVYIYSKKGILIKTLTAGYLPNSIVVY